MGLSANGKISDKTSTPVLFHHDKDMTICAQLDGLISAEDHPRSVGLMLTSFSRPCPSHRQML